MITKLPESDVAVVGFKVSRKITKGQEVRWIEMRKKLMLLGLLAVVCTFSLVGCRKTSRARGADQDTASKDPISVYVVNYPLKYFAERIGGEQVDVVLPVPSDEDPAFWVPDEETIAAFQGADLILLNGAGYAEWVDEVALPESRTRDTSDSFADEYIEIDDPITHSHGPAGKHTHRGTAATTWLDPMLAVKQAEAVCEELTKLRPEHKHWFRKNLESLKGDLKALDHKIGEVVSKTIHLPLVIAHPVYEYFVRRYGVDAKNVNWVPGEEPTEKMWADLGRLLAQYPANAMIWESEPMEQIVAKLQDLGVQVVVFDPCCNVPEDGDYLSVQQSNVKNLKQLPQTAP